MNTHILKLETAYTLFEHKCYILKFSSSNICDFWLFAYPARALKLVYIIYELIFLVDAKIFERKSLYNVLFDIVQFYAILIQSNAYYL